MEDVDAYITCVEHNVKFDKNALGKQPFWKKSGELVRRRWPGE
jgi:hypothetical protein